MKISLNWLKDYIDISCGPEDLSEILTNLGLEVEGLSQIQSIPGGLEGLVTGMVIACSKHPNADRLSITTVDIGEKDLLHIVCGAPNVAAGQKVVVASIGCTLFPVNGDPFKIKRGKIRGEPSEGMICAEDEIGIGTDHSGIIVLPAETPIGMKASDYYEIETDYVFEIGLTPNRSDATSHIGVARDLAAYFNFHDSLNTPLVLPDLSRFQETDHASPIDVIVEDAGGCPRYSGISITNVNIKSSPAWMQNRLRAIDVRPINNIVDITNFVLHEFGQPLHAFDQSKISGNKIVVKSPGKGSEFRSLDGELRQLNDSDLMICDGEEKGMCIAGVYGGLESGVTDQTHDIFLESAHFNATRIRQTSTAHNLRTDAARCFEKGTDPNVTVVALKRAACLMSALAGAKVSSPIVDVYPHPIMPKQIDVKRSNVNKLIGNDLSDLEIKKILSALRIEFKGDDEVYKVKIPTDKADVTREADVIEEILRIYGFNNVVTYDRINTNVNVVEGLDRTALRKMLTGFLTGKGYHEIMGMSLIESHYYKNGLPDYVDKLVYINNTSNVHLDAMRPELMLSGLISIGYNQNRQQQDISFFEFGTSYQKDKDDFQEDQYLTLLLSGNEEGGSWLEVSRPVDFYSIKQTVNEILNRVGLSRYQVTELKDNRFSYGLQYHLGPRTIASFGRTSDDIKELMALKENVFYAELDMKELLLAASNYQMEVSDIPKFPSVKRDLALVVRENVTYGEIERIVSKASGRILAEMSLFDVYKDESAIGAGNKSYAFSMLFVDSNKSLTDKEVDKIIQKIIAMAQNQLSARLR